MFSIVDKEYAEKKDVPEFHPGQLNETYAKTWYHSFSDDEKSLLDCTHFGFHCRIIGHRSSVSAGGSLDP